MHAPGAHQTFGLGLLVGPNGTAAPSRTTIEAEGRGVFAKVKLRFELDGSPAPDDQLFLMEKPSDAVASRIAVNGQAVEPSSEQGEPKILPATQMQAVEEALSVPSSHLLVVEIERARRFPLWS